MLALFLEAFFLTILISDFVGKGDFFSLNIQFSLYVIGLMTLITLTFALTIGAWHVWYLNIMAPLAIAAGILLPVLQSGPVYAFIIGGVSFIIMAAESFRSYRIKNILIRFDSLLVLRFAIKGILLVFSLLAGLMIILNAGRIKEIDLGQAIATVVEKPIRSSVNSQLQQQIERQVIYSGYTEDEIKQVLEDYGVSEDMTASLNTPSLDLDIKGMVQSQVNNLIEPYKEFVRPLIAILVFGLFQLYATISYAVYSLLVVLLIKIAKKTGFLKVFTQTVEKEDLQF
jgi:hypothetical protein